MKELWLVYESIRESNYRLKKTMSIVMLLLRQACSELGACNAAATEKIAML